MKKRILIIEDNANNATLFTRILQAYDLAVAHAWDGESGIQQAIEHRPDLILLDLGLPDVDGHTVASFIRRTPSLEGVPMIAVTAWPEETAREMVSAYGCNDYISKPVVDAKTFAEKILSFLEG